MIFHGRKKELELLRQKNWRNQAQLIVVYGRRRIGKTALVQEAYKNDVIWKFEGLEVGSTKVQIKMFMEQLADYASSPSLKDLDVKTWNQALALLNTELNQRKSVVVFLDEFQWIARMKASFVALFKYYWDNYFIKHTQVRFVICGSVSSFIVKKVLRSKALYGRVNTEINLAPLSIKDAKLFLEGRTSEDILKLYMTFGGVPKYLMEVNPSYSYLQNLNETAFHQNGFFFHEYHRLFISHFSNNSHYEKIIRSLSNTTKTMDQLVKDCKTTKGGTFSNILDDLVLAGFIDKYTPIDKANNSRTYKYRLRDEYLNFYSTFIAQNIEAIQKGEFKYLTFSKNRLSQWQGYAFERLCRTQARVVAEALGFSGISYRSGSWFRSGKGSESGAQADLLFDRSDGVLTVCEIKYTDKLKVKEVKQSFGNLLLVLQDYYPKHHFHKVLLVGKKIPIPKDLSDYFDEVLFSEIFM